MTNSANPLHIFHPQRIFPRATKRLPRREPGRQQRRGKSSRQQGPQISSKHDRRAAPSYLSLPLTDNSGASLDEVPAFEQATLFLSTRAAAAAREEKLKEQPPMPLKTGEEVHRTIPQTSPTDNYGAILDTTSAALSTSSMDNSGDGLRESPRERTAASPHVPNE